MPKNEIKSRLVLEGEAKFRKEMKDAADAIKVLNSEEKLAEAQFKATGDAQEYAQKKAEILRKKIAEQEKAVEAARKAMQELAEKGVGQNSQKMQDWQKKLNTAQTNLLNMQTQLRDTENGLAEQANAFQEAGAAASTYEARISSAARGVTFENAIAAIDRWTGHIEKMFSAVKRAAVYAWTLEADAGKWADELSTAAKVAELDPETYQSWQYASRFIDVEVDDIVKARNRLAKDLGSSSEEMAKNFNSMAIRTRESNGDVRDATEVLWETIDALGKIPNATERAIVAEKLLGKSWSELNPLIEAGSQAYLDMAEEARRNGAIVSAQNIEALAEFDDKRQQLEAHAQATKNTALSALADGFGAVAEAADSALTRIDKWLESDSGKAVMERLSEAIAGFVDSLSEETFESIVNAAAAAVEWLSNGLEWIAENGETVKNICLGIGAAWAGLKISKEVLNFLQLMSVINWTNAAKAFGASGTAASAGAGAKEIVGNGAGTGVATGWKILGAAANVTMVPMGAINNAIEKLEKEAMEAMAPIPMTPEDIEKYFGMGEESGEAYKRGFESAIVGEMGNLLDIYKADPGELIRMVDDIVKAAKEQGLKEIQILDANGDILRLPVDAEDQLINDLYNTIMEAQKVAEEMMEAGGGYAGQNFSIGLANGINDMSGVAIAAAMALAESVAATVQSALDIHSPSRVMEKLGSFVPEGFAAGIEDNLDRVERAVGRMVEATTRQPAEAGRASPDRRQDQGREMRAVLVIDKQVVGEVLAPVIDGIIGAEIQETTR